jgi:hypothetical protein
VTRFTVSSEALWSEHQKERKGLSNLYQEFALMLHLFWWNVSIVYRLFLCLSIDLSLHSLGKSTLWLVFAALSSASDFHDVELLKSIIVFNNWNATYTLARNLVWNQEEKLIYLACLEDFNKYENLRIIQIDCVAFGNTLRNMLYQRRSSNGGMISDSQFNLVLGTIWVREKLPQTKTGLPWIYNLHDDQRNP